MLRSGSSSLLAAALAVAAAPAAAIEPLALPIACTIGSDCAIALYFDADPTPAARDYLCGAMTYDGHAGVDFTVADYAVADAGVDVLAAAYGRVVAVRDGEPDRRGEIDPDAVHARECGNGVVIEHAQGLVTSYCHMRRGSILVQPGAFVARGAVIGQVGQSGLASFPHLHLEVRLAGVSIDPFTARPADGCGLAGIAVWAPETAAALPYFGGYPHHVGFAGERPDPTRLRAGEYNADTLPAAAGAISFWAELWGVAAGDEIALRLTGPDGTVLADNRRWIDRTQSRLIQYITVPAADAAWARGTYTGELTYVRAADGHTWSKTSSVAVGAP